MAEIDMPPQYAGFYSDPSDTEGKVRAAVQTLAADNVNLWATFVLDAVMDNAKLEATRKRLYLAQNNLCREENLPLLEAGWRFPPLSLLNPAPARATSGPSTRKLARILRTAS
jgi:hypothetical protein